MGSRPPRDVADRRSVALRLLGATIVAVTLTAFAAKPRAMPRCGAGLAPIGPRCCASGQFVTEGRCVGEPSACPSGFERMPGGCGILPERARIEGGVSSWQPPDTTLGTGGERVEVPSFWLDRAEVTWARWDRCVAEQRCDSLPTRGRDDAGQAVFGVAREQARTFCRWAKGRLPKDGEWLRAAIGDVELRYPWGDPDALCTRASFGLVDGPCAFGATGPDTAGARPFGATPTGVLDLAGNVAEWVDDDGPGGEGIVRGGSFVDRDATSLRARWRKVVPTSSTERWVGLRCAYDRAD
ncbi:MAG: formylglycine-generating enzyme family protein [Polyangiales bacterium]